MDSDEYFSGQNLKNTGRKQKFGYARKCAIWAGVFLLQVVKLTKQFDSENLVSDLFQAGSALVESKSIKRKTRL